MPFMKNVETTRERNKKFEKILFDAMSNELKSTKKDGPDKGWSWMIAFSSFMLVFILAGLARMSAIYYVELIQFFDITREQATLPFTVRLIIRSLMGPVVGLLGHHFGVRKVTVAGGIFATIGTGLCFIANDIFWFTVFWGGIHGLGYGLANTLHYVPLNQYFVKYRGIAVGISLSGGCFGAFLLPPLIESTIETYGLRGSFVIMAGVVLHTIPMAMLLRPPSWIKTDSGKDTQATTEKAGSDTKQADPSPNLPQKNDGPSETNYSGDWGGKSEDYHFQVNCDSKTNDEAIHYTLSETPPTSESTVCTTANKDTETNRFSEEKSKCSGLKKTLGSLKVMTNVLFLQIGLSLAVYTLIFTIFVTVKLDYARDKGFAEHLGKYVIGAFATGDLVGRLGLGWVIDRKILTVKSFTIISMTSMGAFSMLIPLAPNFGTFLLLGACFGVSEGAVIIMYPLQVGHYLTPEEQPQGLGSACLFSGLISFGIPPLIGHFRDEIGSYDELLLITGAVAILFGLTWFFEPALLKIQHNRVKST